MPPYSIHIHYFAEVLPRLFCHGIFIVAVALVFTAVLQIFTRSGREVGACGIDEVLPQPGGSILSGSTVPGDQAWLQLVTKVEMTDVFACGGVIFHFLR